MNNEDRYSKMQNVVDELCESMKDNHNTGRWLNSANTVDDSVSGLRYWKGTGKLYKFTLWDGYDAHVIFSQTQVRQLNDALQCMRHISADTCQVKVLESFKEKPQPPVLPPKREISEDVTETSLGDLKSYLYIMFIFGLGIFTGIMIAGNWT